VMQVAISNVATASECLCVCVCACACVWRTDTDWLRGAITCRLLRIYVNVHDVSVFRSTCLFDIIIIIIIIIIIYCN